MQQTEKGVPAGAPFLFFVSGHDFCRICNSLTFHSSLDVDSNGVLSLHEFIDPTQAHEISLVGTGVPPGPVGLGDESAGGAYVRYILSSAADGKDIPLVVAVTNGDGEVPVLMEAAFHQLDRNGDNTLDRAEFGVR